MEERNICVLNDVCRIPNGRGTVFITEKTHQIIQNSREYREQRSHARGDRKSNAALRLAWSFLASLAAQENAVLETMWEQSRVAEKATVGLQKCKKETMEALQTFL